MLDDKRHKSVYPHVKCWAPILMFPAQLHTFRQSRVLQVDTTYIDFSSKAPTAPDARPYSTNVVAYWETMQRWVVVAGLWTNSLGAPVLKGCFVFVFTLAKKGNEAWKLSYIETIVIDFSRALFQALEEAAREYATKYPEDLEFCSAEESLDKLVRGCKVHWLRSIVRVATVVRCKYGEVAVEQLRKLADGIPDYEPKEVVQTTFGTLLCNYPALGTWVHWWNRPKTLKILTFAYSKMSLFEWKRNETSNAVESHHRPVKKLSQTGPIELCMRCFRNDQLHGAKVGAFRRSEQYAPEFLQYRQRKERKVDNLSPTKDRSEALDLPFEANLWRDNFDSSVWQRAVTYYEQAMVSEVQVQPPMPDGTIVVQAKSFGISRRIYNPVVITVDFASARVIKANCPCPPEASHCKHVGAIVLASIASTNEPVASTNEEETMDYQVRARTIPHYKRDYRAPDYDSVALDDTTKRVYAHDVCFAPEGTRMGPPDEFGNETVAAPKSASKRRLPMSNARSSKKARRK